MVQEPNAITQALIYWLFDYHPGTRVLFVDAIEKVGSADRQDIYTATREFVEEALASDDRLLLQTLVEAVWEQIDWETVTDAVIQRTRRRSKD
jgi:hypothetical protein